MPKTVFRIIFKKHKRKDCQKYSIHVKLKNDHHSKFSNLSNWKKGFNGTRDFNLVTVSISLSVPFPSSGCSASSTLSSIVCADSRELKRTAVNSSLLTLLSSACNPKQLNSAPS